MRREIWADNEKASASYAICTFKSLLYHTDTDTDTDIDTGTGTHTRNTRTCTRAHLHTRTHAPRALVYIHT